MNNQYPIPEPVKVKQTVDQLRHTRLEMEEFGLELEEINAQLEAHIRQQRLKRSRHSLERLTPKSK
ncbi:MAG: hypothetical protein F6K10_14470 [Moorea sp. SIO2B7]|nr:hypothetical protein [Moorena sp. SIO2B7]